MPDREVPRVEAPRVEAIVVHHGDGEDVPSSLEALRASRGVRLGVTLVHQGPERELPEPIRLYLEETGAGASSPGSVHVELSPVNDGYAAGLNRGLRAVLDREAPDFILLLNPDIWLEPETIRTLVEALEEEPAARAAGPVLVELDASGPGESGALGEGDRRVWNAGSEVDWPSGRGRSLEFGRRLAGVRKKIPRIQSVGYLAGCAVLLEAAAARELFPLEESYFLYYEDAELGERIRRAGGTSLVVNAPGALAGHREGTATGARPGARRYYQARSRILFSRRWAPRGLAPRLFRAAFILRRLLGGGPGALGALDALRGRLRPWESWTR